MAAGTANGGTYHSTIAVASTAELVTMDTTGGDTFLIVNRDGTNALFFTVGDTVTAPPAASASAKGAHVVPANASRLISGISAAPGASVKFSVVTAGTAAYDIEQVS
jgi:hypothetical protein